MRDDVGYKNAADVLPRDMRAAFLALPEARRASAEEFRLRLGKRPSLRTGEGETPLDFRPVTAEDLDTLLETATRASAHTALAQVSAGYISVRGGVRVGLCGEAAVGGSGAVVLRRLSSACVRIPRQAMGCAAGVYRELRAAGLPSTLIVSPPGGGKTTLLRDLIRLISEGGVRVSLADERGEVGAVGDGQPGFDLGGCTDVMTGVPKGEAAMMLLRSMAPQIIAMDEVSAPGDVDAVEAAAGCGVALLATAHAADSAGLGARPVYRRLLELGVFKKCVTIRRRGDGRVYEVGDLP